MIVAIILVSLYGLFCIIAHHRLFEIFETNEAYRDYMVNYVRDSQAQQPELFPQVMTDEQIIELYRHVMSGPWVKCLWLSPMTALVRHPFGYATGVINGNHGW